MCGGAVIPFWHGLRLPSRPLPEGPGSLWIWRPQALLGDTSEPFEGGGPSGSRHLAVAARPGAAPATPSQPGSLTWLRPFANRQARKLSASLVSSAAGSVVCERAARGGCCGTATGGRSSTWVRVRPGLGPGSAGERRGSSSTLLSFAFRK